MAGDETETSAERYMAFISYSQKDRIEAAKLQKWLERFKLPKVATGPNKGNGKLGRIFRDQTDLTAAPSVWPSLKAKIDASDYLIVLCSPHAAQSEWVDKEIRHFRSTGRADHVLALILSGSPNSNDPAVECFPPSFHEMEPLAANLETDGRLTALTRIAASLAGVSFDTLWQRERRRQRRQVALGTGLVSTGLILTATALAAGWLALSGMANVARQSSHLLAREAKAIFNEGNGDIAISTLMALQADPAAQRNAVRRLFDGEKGYPLALARLQSAHANNPLKMILRGHTDSISSVAVTPDGRIITGSADKSARLWDPDSGKTIRTFLGHDDNIVSVAASEKGQLLTGSFDGTAKLWDSHSGELIREFAGFDASVSSVAFADDLGVVMASKYSAQLWDPKSGELIHTYDGHRAVISSVVVAPEGYLYTGSSDNTAALWDLKTGQQLQSFRGHRSIVTSVDVTPSGDLVTGSWDSLAVLWNTQSAAPIRIFEGHDEWVTAVKVTANEELITGSTDGTAQLHDISNGAGLRRCLDMKCRFLPSLRWIKGCLSRVQKTIQRVFGTATPTQPLRFIQFLRVFLSVFRQPEF